MTTIRRAKESDIETLIDMGRALHAESPRYQAMAFSPEKLRRLWPQLQGTLLTEVGCIFVAEGTSGLTGMTIGLAAERWFSDERYLTDLTVYVRPEIRSSLAGGRAFRGLVRALEAWGAEQGLAGPVLGVSTDIHASQTVASYERLGYRLAGYTMVKKNGN
jgi:hypothetical protein